MVLAVVAILLTFILVIGIHEAGHALTARLFQIKVKRISLGFGKPLLMWTTKNGTELVWSLWPLGGYVQLLNSRISSVSPAEEPYCFDKQSVWVRFLVLMSGSIANLIVAWLLLLLIFSVGLNYKAPKIQDVQPNSIAATAGINPGDEIIAMSDIRTLSWREVGMELIINWGKNPVKLTVLSVAKNEYKTLFLDLSHVKFNATSHSLLSTLGIIPDLNVSILKNRATSFLDAVHQTNQTLQHLGYFFVGVLKQVLTGVIPFSVLLGPLGLFVESIVSLMQGLMMFLFFIVTLSVAVAFINLLPIPGLDGGSIVYALIEKARGKPVSVALEILLHRLVFIIFCLMLVQLLLNDLQHYFS